MESSTESLPSEGKAELWGFQSARDTLGYVSARTLFFCDSLGVREQPRQHCEKISKTKTSAQGAIFQPQLYICSTHTHSFTGFIHSHSHTHRPTTSTHWSRLGKTIWVQHKDEGRQLLRPHHISEALPVQQWYTKLRANLYALWETTVMHSNLLCFTIWLQPEQQTAAHYYLSTFALRVQPQEHTGYPG